MIEAYRLQVLNHDPAIEITRVKLAELEFLKGNPVAALQRLDSALSNPAVVLAEIPEHQILYRRAEMLQALNRREEAVSFYRQAVSAASRWRHATLPGEMAAAGSVEAIHSIYFEASDFMAQLGTEQSNDRLRREALEIISINRAADLREQRELMLQRNGELPSKFYQLVERLRVAEANGFLPSAVLRH